MKTTPIASAALVVSTAALLVAGSCEPRCRPGEQIDCSCGGADGFQACASDGRSFEACVCASCGDGMCSSRAESCSTCASDCGACPQCGDGMCNGADSCATCAADCGSCPTCGNGVCESAESCSACPGDCGMCSGTCASAPVISCGTFSCPANSSCAAGSTCNCNAGFTAQSCAGAPCTSGGCTPGNWECRATSTGSCQTLTANIRPVGPPAHYCGPADSSVMAYMLDVNTFYGSGVVPCVYGSDQPFVMGNAVSYGGTGYIYYDPFFLQNMSTTSGSMLPAAMVLAHETGHELQGVSSTGGALSITRELGADCMSGYFLGWLQCQGRVNMVDVYAAFMGACNAGTSEPWWGQTAHGTCDQRVAALRRGVDGYTARANILTQCSF